jgi:hypothetical protein
MSYAYRSWYATGSRSPDSRRCSNAPCAIVHCTRLALAENTVFPPVPVPPAPVPTGDATTSASPDVSPSSAAPQWWHPKNSVPLHAFGADEGYVRRLSSLSPICDSQSTDRWQEPVYQAPHMTAFSL